MSVQQDEQLIPQGGTDTSRCRPTADNDVNMEQQGEAQGKNTNALVLRTLERLVYVVIVYCIYDVLLQQVTMNQLLIHRHSSLLLPHRSVAIQMIHQLN